MISFMGQKKNTCTFTRPKKIIYNLISVTVNLVCQLGTIENQIEEKSLNVLLPCQLSHCCDKIVRSSLKKKEFILA